MQVRRLGRKPTSFQKVFSFGFQSAGFRPLEMRIPWHKTLRCVTFERNFRFGSPKATNYLPMRSFQRTFIIWPGRARDMCQSAPSPKTADHGLPIRFSDTSPSPHDSGSMIPQNITKLQKGSGTRGGITALGAGRTEAFSSHQLCRYLHRYAVGANNVKRL